MKKEQYTLRMLPIVKIALEKERQENGVKDLNNHINSIITLKNQYFSKFDFNTENFPLNVFGQDDIAQKIKSTFESYMEDFKNLSGKTLQSTTLPELMSIIHQNNIKHDYISMNADLGTSNIHKDIKNTKI